ncbi:hypothetical protein CRG98_012112 [Punica granatum]|uniref:Uncharacterized protein n=1 Tax=Punica granatum TaxID=22663 RepID=A0A2I0KGB9_PUNGR|nr:hypothetical protein CRG98_012112 [Punica granatum]
MASRQKTLQLYPKRSHPIRGWTVRGTPDDMRRSWETLGERWDRDAPGEPPIVCSETVEVPNSVSLYYFMIGGAKSESPPIPILLYLDGAVDPLCTCPEPISDRGDCVKGVKGDALVFPNANIRDSRLLVDRVIFFTIDNDALVFGKEFELLMQRGRDNTSGMNPGPPEQEAEGVGDIEVLEGDAKRAGAHVN